MRRTILLSLFLLGATAQARAQGILQARSREGEVPPDALRLSEESIRVHVDQQYATTTLQQTYVSQAASPVEGSYLLRTGGGATVQGFAYWNGGKKIVGEVFEKETAQQVYEQVSGMGRDPGLLEAAGEGAFSFRVFPIQPGEHKRVEVRFGQPLPRRERTVRYRLPISGARSAITVELSDDRPIRAVRSESHELTLERLGPGRLRVTARPAERTELLLAYDLDEAPFTLSATLHKDAGQDGYVVARLALPERMGKEQVSPKDLTLVIDHSGSMSGAPMEQACRAAEAVVRRLRPEDRVNVLIFDDKVDMLYPRPQALTEAIRQEALAYIGRVRSAGGTNIALALRRALESQIADSRPDIVLFLTDGQSDAQAALKAAREGAGEARVFAVGLGSGVEKPLLSRLSAERRGRFTFIESAEAITERVSELFTQIESPVLLDLRVEARGAKLVSTYPRTLPDLVPGDELVLSGRTFGAGPLELTVKGLLGGKEVAYHAKVQVPQRSVRPFAGRMWAQARTDDLLEEIALSGEQDELKSEVINLALAYNFVTRYTAFLAIPESELTGEAKEALSSARERKRAVQAAHKDAVALSRADMPPGDPVLSIRAPRDARQVTAYFPFGLVKDLHYDPRGEQWQVRFLVPKAVTDGLYKARVVIVLRDGTVQMAEASYRIDSAEPDFEASVTAEEGGARLRVVTAEPAREVTVALLGDPRRRVLLTDEGDGRTFSGVLPLPEGEHDLRVVVADRARNEADQVLRCKVGR